MATPLSVPWALDQYLPLITAGAANVRSVAFTREHRRRASPARHPRAGLARARARRSGWSRAVLLLRARGRPEHRRRLEGGPARRRVVGVAPSRRVVHLDGRRVAHPAHASSGCWSAPPSRWPASSSRGSRATRSATPGCSASTPARRRRWSSRSAVLGGAAGRSVWARGAGRAARGRRGVPGGVRRADERRRCGSCWPARPSPRCSSRSSRRSRWPTPTVFDTYRFWVVGSLAGRPPSTVGAVLPFVVVGLRALPAARPAAQRAGARRRGRDLARRCAPAGPACSAPPARRVLCAAAVAAVGPIAFVGLAVPHVVRGFTGSDHRWLLPYCLVLGPVLLLARRRPRPGRRAARRAARRRGDRVRRGAVPHRGRAPAGAGVTRL